MKEVKVADGVTVQDLSQLIRVPARELIQAGFDDLGRLFAILDALSFPEAQALLAHFGYAARRKQK